ncbi:MAG TPA: AAA family ATPase, partial [Pirellulales bacterium]|nr:AAA family ATPase [Pirellulales bacterium]
KACCRLAALLDCSLIEAAKNVVPVARTAAETVDRLRSWAEGRCLAADQGGIYRRQPDKPTAPGRKVSWDPSQN